MKKFGKIFGITTLAFATLTAGVIGLSGCGEKWKNSDKDPIPEEPPAIVNPPAEERPLISVTSLDDLKGYVHSADVNSRFDGVKISAIAPADADIEWNGYELLYLYEEGTENGKIIFKTMGDDATTTNYITSAEKAVFAKTETADGVEKLKLTADEEVNPILQMVSEAYEGAVDATIHLDSMIENWKTVEGFKCVVSKTILGDDVSYNLDFSYKDTEQKTVDNQNIDVQINYTGNYKIAYKNSAVQSYETTLTRQEKGSTEKYTAIVKVENITLIEDFPTDLETYPEVLTLEQLNAFLNSEGISSTFDGLQVTIQEEGRKDRLLSAVKAGENFKATSKNGDEEDDIVYYYSSETNSAFTVDGEVVTKIEDETEIQNISNTLLNAYNNYSSVSVVVSNMIADTEESTNKTIRVVKRSFANRVEFVIEFEYDARYADDDVTYNYSGSASIIFENNIVVSFVADAVQKNATTGEVQMAPHISIVRIGDLEFPENLGA